MAARRRSSRACSYTQSSPSIGATALTAWAPRNPINKYYNGTPREVGAQHILLLAPPAALLLFHPYRAPSLAPRHIPPPASRSSRRKKDLSYTSRSRSRFIPRTLGSRLVLDHVRETSSPTSSSGTPPPTNPPHPGPRRTVRRPSDRARPRGCLSLSIRLFLILPKPATSHHPPLLTGPSSPPPFTFYFSSSELKPRSCAARGRA